MPASPSPSPSPQHPQHSPRHKNGLSGKAKAASDKQTTMKGNDFANAIGINKQANVRAKIAKWQAEVEAGAPGPEDGAAPAPAPASDVQPAPSPQLPSTPKVAPKTAALDEMPELKPPPAPATPAEASPERPKSAKKPQPAHNKLDEDVQTATAPKKRVISDSHWRTRKSPPKDGSNRPSPKSMPTAWVRPAARKSEPAAAAAEPKPSTPPPPKPKPNPIFANKSTGQRTRSQRQRRRSRPASSGNDERPVSSGSGSGEGAKTAEEGVKSAPSSPPLRKKEDTEIVRVRRRPRAKTQTSPRASFSADDAPPPRPRSARPSDTSLSEDPANVVIVEHEESQVTSRRDDELRERRRRSRKKDHSDVSAEGSPKDLPSTSRRHRARRRSHQKEEKEAEEPPAQSPEPAPETPPKKFANRLEAWLQTTPDPFVDSDSRRRRKSSKESISTLELSKPDTSDVNAPTDTKDAPVGDAPERTSSSKRRRRKRSKALKVDSDVQETASSAVTPSATTDTVSSAKESETTPTPSLKRRGAKRTQHSPTKERALSSPLRDSPKETDEDAASSARSSSVAEPSSMELEKISMRPPSENPALRRFFPSTGKRLSTIVSVESFANKTHTVPPSEFTESEADASTVDPIKTIPEVPASEVDSQVNAETSTIVSRKSTRRNKLASHADLISVLSMPKAGTKSIVSARSIRTNRSRLATATTGDIMQELASDETKYMRELRTLVDGVIPVLLSCVLSKSDSALAVGLFSRSASTDPNNVTKPIVDMGVALERLKTLHRRVPKEDPDAFISWAQSAQRVYSEYIGSWRLGFQDVVVSLAPADEDPFTPAKVVNGPDDAAPWDEGLPRNAEGYVVNGNGERVDVAYMLKRPLVRLKYLAKSLKGINHVRPSERAEKMANNFQDLVTAARKRSNDEHARLEDEAAAKIDPTRARDPRSLAPLAGVRIDPTRCVRARDHFDMHLYHSSGQEVDCRVEMLLRGDAPGNGKGGDVLLCEVDNNGRWLLLPPIQQSRVSARNGDLQGEIIVMIRGHQSDGKEWSEVMSLTTEDEQAGFEWVQLLGLDPVPPQVSDLKRDQSTPQKSSRPTSSHASSSLVSGATGSTLPQKSRTPSPHEVEIPIGEQAKGTSKKWGYETPDRVSQSSTVSPITPPSEGSSGVGDRSKPTPVSPPSPIDVRQSTENQAQAPTRDRSYTEGTDHDRTPRSLNEAMQQAGTGSPQGLRRTKAKRLSKNVASPTTSPRPSRQITLDDPEEAIEEVKPTKKLSKRQRPAPPSSTPSTVSQASKGFSVWMPPSEAEYSDESDSDKSSVEDAPQSPPPRPQPHRRASSVPTMDLPTIPKIRKTSQPSTPVNEPEPEPVEVQAPASAPPKVEKKRPKSTPEPIKKAAPLPEEDEEDQPPPVPPHRSPSPATPVTLKASNTPVFTPKPSGFKDRRRSSSPLKHEYEPSTCTESSSESEEEISEDDDSITSGSEDDELDDDVPTPLMPFGQIKPLPKVSPPESTFTLPNGTITPSQSASQTPYRAVPQTSGQATKAIASIFSWADAGRWDNLHPDECSIVVTPGKIEVFEITAMHSKPLVADGDEIIQPGGKPPLVAVELTPLVPLRKSTAIDISIRSPPTADSRIKSGNNIMLRSRNPAECAQLYAMINQSRINNPTYIALQNARGPYGQTSWAEAMDRQNAARTNAESSGGWFGGSIGRRSSYRKTSTRAASISAATESSVGTMNTALRSALGRFSFAKNGRFSIRDSTLGSRSTNSLDTGSSGSGSGRSTPNVGEPGRAPGAPAGITSTKCRLYERDSLTKWRDMGSARLTIMLPSVPAPGSPTVASHQRSPGARNPTQEKRILIVGKSKGETLLDVTLSESCFERVARSGIAVSVWEDIIGEDGQVGRVAKTGGVSGSRARIFMVQMKSERECAYVFGLVGKLRY